MGNTRMENLTGVPNGPAKWVAIWLLCNVFFVGCYDVFALLREDQLSTVSSYIQTWSSQWPMLAFLCGMIAGHLWFRG